METIKNLGALGFAVFLFAAIGVIFLAVLLWAVGFVG